MVFEVKDKVVVITGGGSGIGAQMVKGFLKEQAKHVIAIDVAKDAGTVLEKELNDKYNRKKVTFVHCDITDEEKFKNLFDAVVKEHGHIDVLINNAGILNDSPNGYKKSIMVNVSSLVAGTLKALELMRKDEGGIGGTIINISSTSALTQVPWVPIYGATKSFVLQFSNCIGMEAQNSRTGVRVLTVCFGATKTPLLQNMGSIDKVSSENLNALSNNMPKQSPESVVKAVVETYRTGESGSTWLATDDSPAKDITTEVKEAYEILSKTFIPK